jgi:serine protein kinase
MAQKKAGADFAPNTLDFHISEVINGKRRFENAFQAVSRMILDEPDGIKKSNSQRKINLRFQSFSQKKKTHHWYVR